MDDRTRLARIQELLDRAGDRELRQALGLMAEWLRVYGLELAALPSRRRARRPLLWRCLADLVERSGDQRLLEQFWQILDRLAPRLQPLQPLEPGAQGLELPLLGVPILNGPEHLQRLLASLDLPVQTLALVDNSGGPGPVRQLLETLERQGHPRVRQVRVARNFGNGGVAASWNQILTAFPAAPLALIANHDVVFSPGALAQALRALDPTRPQWLPLLPGAAAFSAFLITALAWNRLGLFEAAFHPAYFEDSDYRDRLLADPEVACLEEGPWLEPMAAANPIASATLAADPQLRQWNEASFQLNRLWYFSRRRLLGDRRGEWLRRWLAEWAGEAPT